MNRPRVLLVAAGTWHDFPGCARALADAFAPVADCDITHDPGRLSHAGLRGYRGLVTYACLFADDTAIGDRARAAISMDGQRAVERFVAAGGGFLPLHGTLCSWDGWTRLGEVMGMRWVQGVSAHDPMETFTVRVNRAHPLALGLDASFEIHDEKYHLLRPIRPVAGLLEADWRGAPQPLGWTTTWGRGRVHVNALGHTVEALGHPAVRRLLANGLRWALA